MKTLKSIALSAAIILGAVGCNHPQLPTDDYTSVDFNYDGWNWTAYEGQHKDVTIRGHYLISDLELHKISATQPRAGQIHRAANHWTKKTYGNNCIIFPLTAYPKGLEFEYQCF